MTLTRWVVAVLVVLSACSAPPSTDGGQGGGAGASGGGGGSGGGGATSDGGAFTVVCRATEVVTDAGVDSTALLGTACAPADLDALIQTCRVEPIDYFFNSRCGTTAVAGRYLEVIRNSGIYSCAVIGADVLACVAPRVNECLNPDGGQPLDVAAQRLFSECNAQLGRPRYLQTCFDACTARHDACFTGCRNCGGFESCADCSFQCGKQLVDCVRPCPPP